MEQLSAKGHMISKLTHHSLMSLAFHGNYCGPGWSAGKYQQSVVSDVPAVDAFDASCKLHDAAYAQHDDLMQADFQFAFDNVTSGLFGLDVPRVVAGLAVGAQGVFRSIGLLSARDTTPVSTPILVPTLESRSPASTNQMPKRPAPSAAKMPAPKRVRANNSKTVSNPVPPVRITTPPVSIGTTIQSSKPSTRQTAQGVVVAHREFMTSVYETSNTNWQLSALAPMNPSYYPGSVMGNFCRSYAKYRFRRAIVHFVTRQPTSVTGEIALVFASQALLPCENGASASFLARVMSRGNAVLGPLWTSHSMEIPCDNVWRNVNAAAISSYVDNVMGEIQAYTLSGVSDTAGYLIMDYELEFAESLFTPQSGQIPVVTGPGASYSLIDSSTTPTANNAVSLTCSNLTGGSSPGSIFTLVINADESTVATGTTLSNAWSVSTEYATSTSATSADVRNITIIDGLRVFAVNVGGGVIRLYTSLESAITGEGSGQLFYGTTGSSAATWLSNGYLVRLSPSQLASTS